MEFTDLRLNPLLLDALQSMNFQKATPIQEQAIPLILEGRDLIGIAQTGTGKTAAFVLPVLSKILDNPEGNATKALIIVPTRELALQIDQAVEAFSYFTGIASVAIYGGGDGQDFYQEKQAMQNGVDIVIATPGRLISHMHAGNVNFSQLRFLILDEADRMLDMGFMPDISRIIRILNEDRQTLMFSATMPSGVNQLAHSLLKVPATVQIALSKPAEKVKQSAFVIFDQQKNPLIKHLLSQEERKSQTIVVFCSAKDNVRHLYQELKQSGFNVGRISSDLEQDQREEVMNKFRNGKLNVLVATDVISRGIDVEGIDMVINYDVPRDAEDYVHRIGRTGRAQRSGEAVTLISPRDQQSFAKIENLIGAVVEKSPLPEFLGAAPEYKGRNAGGDKSQGQKRRPPFRRNGSKPGGKGRGSSSPKGNGNPRPAQ